MSTLSTFPPECPLINQYVKEIRLNYALSRNDEDPSILPVLDEAVEHGARVDYRYYDYFVTLKDGRCFGFSACTPEYIRDSLDRSQALSFVESGLVVVAEVTVPALLDALEQCLEKAELYGLEHFGFRCTGEAK
jgi:hypothetical protein